MKSRFPVIPLLKLPVALAIIISTALLAPIMAEELESDNVLDYTPAKKDGYWPNDARDTFWYGDYETAMAVARKSDRPLFLVINRGAVCEV